MYAITVDCMQGDYLFRPIKADDGKTTGIEVACCGDDAMMTVVDSLVFALEALLDECEQTKE